METDLLAEDRYAKKNCIILKHCMKTKVAVSVQFLGVGFEKIQNIRSAIKVLLLESRVDNHVRLGQNITAERNIRRESTRTNRAGWNSFNSMKTVLIATTDKSLGSQLFNSTVLPAISYGSETWSLTKADETRPAVAERERWKEGC